MAGVRFVRRPPKRAAVSSGVPKDRVPPGSQTSLREANRARLIDAVQKRGSITQVELVGATGLSAATISNIVKELTAAGVLNTSPTSRSGRRAQLVTLARNLGLVAGVHFSERSMRVALADVTQRVIAEQRLPLPPEHRADSSLDTAAMLIDEMLDSVGAARSELLAVGVGIPAPVHPATGTVSASGVLRSWDGVVVPDVLEQRLGVPVHVDNDANLGAVAEARLGVARGMRHLIYLRAAHGLALGMIMDGKIVHGRAGLAGEIGHLVTDGDVACRCGNTGCLETTVGVDVLLARLRPEYGHLTLRDVISQAHDGDAVLQEVLAETGRSLGRALALACTLLDPEMVVIGGELAHAGEILVEPLRETVHARAMPGSAGPVPVVAGLLGDQAEVRGALARALEHSAVVATRMGAR